MKLTKTSVALAAVAGLLALSPATFAQETKPSRDSTPPAGGRGGRGGMSIENRLAEFSEHLKLTDEQRPKVKAALEEQSKAMQGSRDLPQEERRAKMLAAREELNKKMKEILTPEQFKKYEEMQPQRGQRRGPGEGAPPAGNPEKPAEKAGKPAEK
jgi:Spy/CpxP family protein refolding chaperone